MDKELTLAERERLNIVIGSEPREAEAPLRDYASSR